MPNKRIVSIVISLLVLVTVSALVFKWLAKPASAAWWNDNWAYRQKVIISNSGSTQTNFQVSITMDTATPIAAGKMQSSCQDIRILDANSVQVPFVIEEGPTPCDNASTKIWVKLASIPTSDQVLYIYYGNSTANSVANGNAVFDFYDDFTYLNTNTWTATGSQSISSGAITITTGSVYSNSQVLTDSRSYIYEFRSKRSSTLVNYAGMMINNTQSSAGGNSESDKLIYMMPPSGNLGLEGWAADGGAASYNLTSSLTLYTATADTYYINGFSMDSSEIKFWKDGSQTGTTVTGSWTAAPYLWLGYYTGSAASTTDITDITVDWVRARKYASTAPTAGSPAAEEKGPAPISYWKLDEGTGSTIYDSMVAANNATTLVTSLNSGDGADGSITLTTSKNMNTDVIATGRSTYADGIAYRVIAPADSATSVTRFLGTVTLSNGIAAGDELLLINLKGTSSDYADVGNYEFMQVSSVTASTITFTTAITKSFDGTTASNQSVVVQRVPNYTDVTLNSSGSLTASAWDSLATTPTGGVGYLTGIVAFRASGTVTVNSGGSITVAAKGHEGGAGQVANNGGKGGKTYNGTAGNGATGGAGGTGQGGGGGGGCCATGAGGAGATGGGGGGGGDWNSGYGGGGGYGSVGKGGSGARGHAGINGADGSGTTGGTGGSASGDAGGGGGGGTYGAAALSTIFLGSGGASGGGWGAPGGTSGAGGKGGGIIFVASPTITVNTGGAVSSNGGSAGNYSGGGAGGSILFQGTTVTLGSSLVTAAAGTGATNGSGTGGDGGTGRIHVDYSSISGSTSPSADTSTLSSATTTTWEQESECTSGKCLFFDGTDDVVYKEYSSDTELDPSTSSFSISAWFKHTSTLSGTDTLISRYSGAGYKIYTSSSGFCFGIDDDSTFGPDDSACDTNNTYADSTWHHVVATKNGTTSISLYIDGVRVAQKSGLTANGSLSGSSPTFYIGMDSDGTSNPWTGFVDEVKYYNFLRSDEQIKTDFIGLGAAKGAAESYSPNQSNLSNGLIGYWKQDESSWNGTAGEVIDSSGNGYNGTSSGSVTTSTGKFGRGGSFDGTDDTVSVSSFDISSTNKITVAFWLNWTTFSTNNDHALTIDGSTTDLGVNPNDDSGNFRVCLTGNVGVNCVAFTRPSAGVWHHYTFVVDTSQTLEEIIPYVDGQAIAYGKSTDTNNNTANFDSSTINFMRYYTASLYGQGSMDELRIYNTSFTPDRVSLLYNFAPGPIGWWKLDENTSTSANDSSATGLTGTLGTGTATPQWIPGKFGSGLSFDGSDDKVTYGSSTALDTYNITVEAWVNTDVNTTLLTAVSRDDSGSGTRDWMLGIGTAGNFRFSVFVGNTQYDAEATTGFSTGTWHHLAGTYDGETVSMYVDGAFINSDTTPSGNLDTDAVNLQIGSRTGNTAFWDGSVDDVRVYNYSRSSKQIIEDMNAGHPTGGSPISSQVAYWAFDSQSGQTVYDKSVSGLNGTLGADSSASTDDPAWKVAGSGNCKVNGCLSFDGGDYIGSLSNPTALDFAVNSPMTITAWVSVSSFPTTGNYEYIVSKGYDLSTEAYALRLQNDSGTQRLRIGSFDGADHHVTWDISGWNTDEWHHIAGLYDGTNWKLYFDGNLMATNTSDGPEDNSRNVVIGAFDNNGTINSRFFSGAIDEVKIYNSGLSTSEILVDMNAGSNAAMGGVLGTQNNEGFGSLTPTAWWKMDENTGTSTTYDSSGNGYDGTLNSITSSSWVPGKVGSALSFDGSADYFAPSSISIPDNTDLSVSVWVKIDDSWSGSTATIFAGCNDPSAPPACSGNDYDGVIFRVLASGQFDFAIYYYRSGANRCDFRTSTGVVNYGEWVHLAATYDENDASGVGTLYVNGVPQTLSTNDCTSVTSAATTLYPAIGVLKSSNNGASAQYSGYTKGVIDNVKFYQTLLTQAQVEYDYNRGSPVAWYKFDECQGSTAYNSAPAANGQAAGINGTISAVSLGNTSVGTCNSGTNTEMWDDGTTGKLNASLGFDGADDNVNVPDDNTIDIGSQKSFTGWFNVTDAADDRYILFKNAEYIVRIDSTDTLSFFLYDGVDYEPHISTPTAPSAGTWHHFAAVYDSTLSGNQTKLYLDGNLAAQADRSITVSATANNLEISAAGAPFEGLLDDIRIYNYALSASQVKEIMLGAEHGSAVRYGPSTGSP